MKLNKYIIEILVFVISFIFFEIIGSLFWTSIGLSLFFFFSIRLYRKISTTVDIRDIIIIMPLLQWIVGPYLSYNYLTDKVFYYMITPENQYMKFVVPSMILFSTGLYLPFSKTVLNFDNIINTTKEILKKYPYLDLLFIILGIFFRIISNSLPISLRFFTFLIGNLHFIGLFFLIINDRKYKKLLLLFTVSFAIIFSLNEALFHILITWFIFLFMIIAVILKFSNRKKMIIFSILLFSSVIIQIVKHDYRTYLDKNVNISYVDKASAFFLIAKEKIKTKQTFTSETTINNFISRINQGWIIARVMYWVPSYEPFANGETIKEAIISAIVPRFIYSNKKIAGGREKYMRFTGKNLEIGTSMNISIIGEAYVNYSNLGAIVFMFLYGAFLGLFLYLLQRRIIKTPTLLFFLPIIFLQVIKAETDFVSVLNHLVKASIFVALLYFGFRKILGINL